MGGRGWNTLRTDGRPVCNLISNSDECREEEGGTNETLTIGDMGAVCILLALAPSICLKLFQNK